MTAEDVIRLLELKPHPLEGGYYRETYRSVESRGPDPSSSRPRSLATAIYFLLTPDTFSALHRLPADEIFHHYAGDPVKMLQLDPAGGGRVLVLGRALERGERPQAVVPRGVWQGSRLQSGGRFALLGTTMAPGFDLADYEPGAREDLSAAWPQFRREIRALTR